MDAVQRLQSFLRLTEAVSRAPSMAEVYEAALDCVEQCLGVTRASLLLFDPDGVMRFKAWRGLSDVYRARVEGHTPWTPETVTPPPLVATDVLADADLAAYHDVFRRENIRGLVFVPLTGGGKVVGKFMIYYADPVTESAEDLREAMIVADQISLALERRRSEERLRQLNSLLQGLVDNLPVGVSYVDHQDRLRYANSALCSILGVASVEPYIGQDVSLIRNAISAIFVDPEQYFRVTREQHRLAEPVPTMEFQLIGGRTLERRYFPVHSGQELVGHLVMMEDITERRLLEAQVLHAHKMDSIGQLAGGIAHDFNNLLMAITGHLDLARSDVPADSAVAASLSHALEASTQAAALTRQLLAFARRQPVQPVTLDLHVLLHRVKPMLRRLIREDIVMHKACIGEAAWVRADEGHLEQVLVNLVLNARDAMPSGGELWLTCEHVADGHSAGTVVLTVRDTGVGMDAGTRARIFEPFYTTKELGRGTGLGLATVYGIVQQAGGRIEVESAAGQGTTFRVEFPGVEPPPDVPARPFGQAPETMPRGDESVLLVEDDVMVRLLAETMLRRLGYRVQVAGSGEEALQWLASYDGALHVLLTDLVMPGMNGRELAREVVRQRPGVQVLLMSGYAPPSEAEDPTGFRFIAKPFSAEALARHVHDALSNGAVRVGSPS